MKKYSTGYISLLLFFLIVGLQNVGAQVGGQAGYWSDNHGPFFLPSYPAPNAGETIEYVYVNSGAALISDTGEGFGISVDLTTYERITRTTSSGTTVVHRWTDHSHVHWTREDNCAVSTRPDLVQTISGNDDPVSVAIWTCSGPPGAATTEDGLHTIAVPGGTLSYGVSSVSYIDDYCSPDLITFLSGWGSYYELSVTYSGPPPALPSQMPDDIGGQSCDGKKKQINCGGAAVESFSADCCYNSGSSGSTTSSINLSGVSNPAPLLVYQTWRANYYSTMPLEYRFSGFSECMNYKIKLHFSENYFYSVGDSIFDIKINGATYWLNFDILATAGSRNKAVALETISSSNSNGEFIITLQPKPGNYGYSNASINGIEILPQ